MKLQELSLENLQDINGGLCAVDPAEGARPSGECGYKDLINAAKDAKFLYDMYKLATAR